MENTIIYLAEVRNPYTTATSSQIMTDNLLFGFRQLCNKLVLIAIIEEPKDAPVLHEYYNNKCDRIFCINRVTYNGSVKWLSVFSMLWHTTTHIGLKIPKEILKEITEESIVISHSPCVDSAILGTALKKKGKIKKHIEYWSDPMALSMLRPEEMNYKRVALALVEKKTHKGADRIVYGTKSLYRSEITLFPKEINKSDWCEVSYCETNSVENRNNGILTFGYFGNYYSNIRNIGPVYEAFRDIDKANLVIYGSGDIKLNSTNNISINNRFPRAEAESMENMQDVIICILNRAGMQVPGKIFYMTNQNKIILVLVDGVEGENIKNDLLESRRFVFCNNIKEDIVRIVNQIIDGQIELDMSGIGRYSPKSVCKKILGY